MWAYNLSFKMEIIPSANLTHSRCIQLTELLKKMFSRTHQFPTIDNCTELLTKVSKSCLSLGKTRKCQLVPPENSIA